MRNQNSRSKLQPYPPSPLVRIHLNCQIQEKRKKNTQKGFSCPNTFIKTQKFLPTCLEVFRIKDIFEWDTFFCPNFYGWYFFLLFFYFPNFGPKLWNTIIIFMKILAQFAWDKWYTFAAYPRLRNLFDRPLPICLAFEKIHSFFESEVESIGFLWGRGDNFHTSKGFFS